MAPPRCNLGRCQNSWRLHRPPASPAPRSSRDRWLSLHPTGLGPLSPPCVPNPWGQGPARARGSFFTSAGPALSNYKSGASSQAGCARGQVEAKQGGPSLSPHHENRLRSHHHQGTFTNGTPQIPSSILSPRSVPQLLGRGLAGPPPAAVPRRALIRLCPRSCGRASRFCTAQPPTANAFPRRSPFEPHRGTNLTLHPLGGFPGVPQFPPNPQNPVFWPGEGVSLPSPRRDPAEAARPESRRASSRHPGVSHQRPGPAQRGPALLLLI